MNQPPRRSWPARRKKYNWFCVDNSFSGHKKWRYVARVLDIQICVVQAIVLDLLGFANKSDSGKARGSVTGWSPHDCSGALDLEPELCARVYAKLEEIGWIDQDYIVNWDDHQLQGEHPDQVAERKRRQRAKVSQQRRGLVKEQTDETTDAEKDYARWLLAVGVKIVSERMDIGSVNAQKYIVAWLKEIDNDATALAEYITAADHQRLAKTAFQTVVSQKVRDLSRVKHGGPLLPLAMTVLKGGAAG